MNLKNNDKSNQTKMNSNFHPVSPISPVSHSLGNSSPSKTDKNQDLQKLNIELFDELDIMHKTAINTINNYKIEQSVGSKGNDIVNLDNLNENNDINKNNKLSKDIESALEKKNDIINRQNL